MGLFDSVLVSCPKYRGIIELQTKSGVCQLITIDTYEKTPIEMVAGLPSNATCPSCGETFSVHTKKKVKVRLE